MALIEKYVKTSRLQEAILSHILPGLRGVMNQFANDDGLVSYESILAAAELKHSKSMGIDECFALLRKLRHLHPPDMICEQFIGVATAGSGLKVPDGEVIDQKDVGEDDYVFSAITPKRFSNATVRMDPFEATRNALESLLTNIRVQKIESPYVKARSGMLDTEEHTEEKRDLSGLQVVSGGLQRYAQTVAENKWADTYEAFQ